MYEKGRLSYTWTFKNGEPYARSLDKIKNELEKIAKVPDKKVDDETAEREAALRRLKAYRYLCELPYANLTLDKEMNACALAGAQAVRENRRA